MKRGIAVVGLGLLVTFSFYAPPAQNLAAAQESGFVERGTQLYKKYCASCHGVDAKGKGPAAEALKTRPTDLTMIQKRGEDFPTLRVNNIISGEKVVSAHGSRDMPVWGEYFAKTEPGRERPYILSLTKYLESIQMN